MGMEELGPSCVFLGISSNANFQAIRTWSIELKRKMVFDNIKEIHPSPFQILMLELALAAPS
jgi:hypothetical protein